MTQRTWPACWPCRCSSRCGVAAAFMPLPYVTYAPGLTVDVLGETDGKRSSRSAGTGPTATTASCG